MNGTASSAINRQPPEEILRSAEHWRREIPGDLHEHLVEAIYAQAARIADRCVSRPEHAARPTLDRTIDRIVSSRVWGFPIMLLLFAVMFWITISGANVPSGLLARFLDPMHKHGIRAQQSCRDISERRRARTGECRDIDERFGLVSSGEAQRVR